MGKDSGLGKGKFAGKKNLAGMERFSMVKEMHRKSLGKAIREKKADRQMIPLCKFVSGTKHYFTSSSCAGRIILLQLPEDENKLEAFFHRKWHRRVMGKELWEGIRAETRGELWFKLDPFILHIGADSLENAKKVLRHIKKSGVRRGGIMVAKPGKFLIEMQGSQGISFPVKKGKKVLVEEDYMKYVLERANQKLEKNYSLLKRLEKVFREELE